MPVSRKQAAIDAIQKIQLGDDARIAVLKKIAASSSQTEFLMAMQQDRSNLGIGEDVYDFTKSRRGDRQKLFSDIKKAAVDKLAALELEQLAAEARAVQPPADTTIGGGNAPSQANLANFLMEKNSRLKFVDTLVELKGNNFYKDFYRSLTEDGDGISVGYQADQATVYQGVKLTQKDVIRSAQVFKQGDSKGNNSHVGLIKMDHTGKVTDMSVPNLTNDEKNQVALKQAKMLLSNFHADRGPIVISAGKPDSPYKVDMANKVYAALLLFTHGMNLANDIKIISQVQGCGGPKLAQDATWYMRAKPAETRDDFVAKHLGEHILDKINAETPNAINAQIRELRDLRQNTTASYQNKIRTIRGRDGNDVKVDEDIELTDQGPPRGPRP